jgi:hypothetical protein
MPVVAPHHYCKLILLVVVSYDILSETIHFDYNGYLNLPLKYRFKIHISSKDNQIWIIYSCLHCDTQKNSWHSPKRITWLHTSDQALELNSPITSLNSLLTLNILSGGLLKRCINMTLGIGTSYLQNIRNTMMHSGRMLYWLTLLSFLQEPLWTIVKVDFFILENQMC